MKNKEKYDLSKLILEDETSGGKIVYMAVYEKDTSDRKKLFEKKYITQPIYPFHLLVDFANWLEEEYVPNILDEKEKEYLAAVIKPFREDVRYIEKRCFVLESEYISIGFQSNETLTFPLFKIGKMYKGMKPYKEYTLEELGL